jgi:voltage-gated potassium channel
VSLRSTVHGLLASGSPTGQWLRFALAALIVLNIGALVLETVPWIGDRYRGAFRAFELASIAVFAIEYAARLWTAPEEPRYRAPVTGRLRWMLTPGALIDLAAILPSLLVQAGFDLRALRLVRLSRLLRMARLGRYSFAVQTLQRVLKAKAPDLLSLLFLLLGLLVLSSTLMFFLENDAQPQAFSSIPATMWWGIITLTTIGYGDMAPVTVGGRLLGAVIAILGIGMFALPAGLLGAAFVDELGKARARGATGATGDTAPATAACPHCGKPL